MVRLFRLRGERRCERTVAALRLLRRPRTPLLTVAIACQRRLGLLRIETLPATQRAGFQERNEADRSNRRRSLDEHFPDGLFGRVDELILQRFQQVHRCRRPNRRMRQSRIFPLRFLACVINIVPKRPAQERFFSGRRGVWAESMREPQIEKIDVIFWCSWPGFGLKKFFHQG